jgi:hypothetical protein
MELREPLVPDIPRHEVFRNNALHLAARPQHRIRDNPHQTHVAAAVHQADVSPHQFGSHLLGGSAVLWAATRTGAAENADSFHAVILNLGFARERESIPEDAQRKGWIRKQTMTWRLNDNKWVIQRGKLMQQEVIHSGDNAHPYSK